MTRTRIDIPDTFIYVIGTRGKQSRFATMINHHKHLKDEINEWLEHTGIKCYVYLHRRCVYFDTPSDAIRFKLQMPEWEQKFKPDPLTFNILKQTINAKSRKLSATWTFEIDYSVDAQYGLNIPSTK